MMFVSLKGRDVFSLRCLTGLMLAVLLFSMMPSAALAQYHHAFYRMLAVPQSTALNPAFDRESDAFIGMPALSSFYINYLHTGFAWEDFLRRDQQGAFYYDEDYMLDQLRQHTLFSLNINEEWLSGGFRRNGTDFYLGISEKLYLTSNYSRDLMTLLIKGNEHFARAGRMGDLRGFSLDMVHYREFAFSMSRKLTEKTRGGLRAKALFGQATAWFGKSEMQFVTDPDTYAWLIDADVRLHISAPLAFSRGDGMALSARLTASADEYLLNFRNPGLAIDLGVEHELYPSVYLGLSLLDIGVIYWRDEIQSHFLQGQFDYRGLDFRDMADQLSLNGLEAVIDSVLDLFDVREAQRAFVMSLNPSVYASLFFQPSQKHTVGIIGRGILFRKKLHPSVAVQYQYKVSENAGLSFSYAAMSGSYFNPGAGAYVGLGPVQVFMVLDNLVAFMRPHTAQLANIHFGLNWVFAKKQETDVPWRCNF